MPSPSKRRLLAITSHGLNIGMAFTAPGGHLQVWEILPSPTAENRVYDAIKNLRPTTVITCSSGPAALRAGITAVCYVLQTPLKIHSVSRSLPQVPHARERLLLLRSGEHVEAQVGNDEVLALAHAMVHLEEITRDHIARGLRMEVRENA